MDYSYTAICNTRAGLWAERILILRKYSPPTRLCDSATLKRIAFQDHIQHKQIIVILRDLESRRLEVFFFVMIHRVHEDVIFQSCGIRDFLKTSS